MPDNVSNTQPDRAEQLRNSPMSTLLMVPTSKEALALEERLLDSFLEAERTVQPRGRARRASAVTNLRRTISAFTADLVLHSIVEPSGGYCYRSFNREAFSETVAEYRQFEAVVEVWTALGLIEVVLGFQATEDFDGDVIRTRGWATRFRATPMLLSIAAEFGITPSAIGDHYKAETGRTFPIELRAKKKSRGTGSGKRMALNKSDPQVQQLAAEVREINQFLTGFTCSFEEPPRFRRIFNNGDRSGFAWDQGGRLFSYGGDSYQQKKSDFRKTITIDGEATVELDIRSSQLTIAYGLGGEPLPPGDPYRIEGLPRAIVKAIVTATIGKGGPPSRWPTEFAKDYLKSNGRRVSQDFTLGDAVERVMATHPLLRRLGALGVDVYRLQYVESQILQRAILRLLRESQAPSLPVFDCLIVRGRDEDRARVILEEEFTKEVGILPTITIK